MAFDFRGAGRFGGYAIDAPFEVLIAGVEVAWDASDADAVQVSAVWSDDPDWDAPLRAAGWTLDAPRRRRFLGLTISHGLLQGQAEASDRGSFRRLLVAANADEMPSGPEQVRVMLPADGSGSTWTLTLYKDVLEVIVSGDDGSSTLAAVTSELAQAATRAGLRLNERK